MADEVTRRISRVAWVIVLTGFVLAFVAAVGGHGVLAMLAVALAILCVPIAHAAGMADWETDVHLDPGSGGEDARADGVHGDGQRDDPGELADGLPEGDAWRTDPTGSNWMLRLARVEYDPAWDRLLAPVVGLVGLAALATAVRYGDGGRVRVWLFVVATICLNGALLAFATSYAR